ncbi:hypothetical protein BTVI_127038 [Pitangus sulphuratus]|nr:hypothetical protein BTVI_127038 [Pitangus sulphuratus]
MPPRKTLTDFRGGPVQTSKFNQAKCKVLHLGQGNPKQSISWVEKDLGVFVDEKFNISWQCEPASHKAKHILGCITRSMASKSREVILPFYSAFRDPTWSAVSRSGAPTKKDMDLLEQVQRRATEMIRGLEHLSYKDRLRE